DPEFAEAVNEINEVSLDFVESTLFKLIAKGNVAATIFFLKTRAKRRGYTERNEIEHTGRAGGPRPADGTFKSGIMDEPDLSALSTAELKQLKTMQAKLDAVPEKDETAKLKAKER